MPTLILVVGLPGVGKTTLCRLIQSELNCEFFNSDDFAEKSAFFKTYPTSELSDSQLAFLRVEFYKHKVDFVKKLLMKERIVVMDAVFDLPKVRAVIYGAIKEAGIDLIIIKVVCPDKITRERIRRDKTKTRKGASSQGRLNMYERMKASWKPIRRKHTVVNSSKSLLPQIAKLMKQFR